MNRPKNNRRGRSQPRQAPGLAARLGALRQLQSVLDQGAMLEDQRGSGAPEDRAAARALADLTLRRLGQIDDAIDRFVERTPKGAAQHILRLMAAELLFQGTPPHAAVDLAVRLARQGKGSSRAAGMINAVGRRLAEQGADIVAGQDPVALNLPGWLAKALRQDWGAEAAKAIGEAQLKPALHDLTLANPADGPALAHEVGGELLPNGSLRLFGRPQISALPGYAAGAWWVQDAAASLPARLLGDVDGLRVLDLCAAPGGKTLQLAAAGANVTSLDQSGARLARVKENLARTGLSAELVEADALDWRPEAPFDAVLLDAPCSATGTIRRHPDLPLRGRGQGLPQLVQLQADLLDRAADAVAIGGTLVFCTCSLFRAEGEDQATGFLARHPGFEAVPVEPSDSIPAEFVTSDGCLRMRPDIWADRGSIDGFFAARFRRKA